MSMSMVQEMRVPVFPLLWPMSPVQAGSRHKATEKQNLWFYSILEEYWRVVVCAFWLSTLFYVENPLCLAEQRKGWQNLWRTLSTKNKKQKPSVWFKIVWSLKVTILGCDMKNLLWRQRLNLFSRTWHANTLLREDGIHWPFWHFFSTCHFADKDTHVHFNIASYYYIYILVIWAMSTLWVRSL